MYALTNIIMYEHDVMPKMCLCFLFYMNTNMLLEVRNFESVLQCCIY